jgi:aryl-alcohol dehydrogenase-like predicted oxidoreductase
MIQGCASSTGTARYATRFHQFQSAAHFRKAPQVPEVEELLLSSIGLGTYLGDPTDAADQNYTDAVELALKSGINVLDTAINYRHQRSERNIGAALLRAIDSGAVSRDEALVCTKAGYLPFDANMPADAVGYLRREYVETGIAPAGEIVGGSHCMHPQYLADQVERSRRNLGIETLDVFYVHNPETQLGHVSDDIFYRRLRAAFEMLESAIVQHKIQWYGAATWGGFRANPMDRSYLSLERMVSCARDVAGDKHHFRFVQLPFNLAMLEAFAYGNQVRNGGAASLLQQAPEFGVAVVASGTLYQGNLAQGLPAELKQAMQADTDAEAALQFARSATNLATALVGMGRPEHVISNTRLAARRPIAKGEWESLFTSRK